MSSEHADPAITVRPPAEVLTAAKAVLDMRGLDMRGFIVASLAALAERPDRVLENLAPRWPPPKRRGQPRPTAGVIYAVRRVGDPTWHGQPDLLPAGQYETGTLEFTPVITNHFTGPLQVRYGPVPDDTVPSYYTFTTVGGTRVRPSGTVHQLLFGDTPPAARPNQG